MLSRVHSVGLRGIEGFPVVVELEVCGGLPAFATIGLPDAAVRESRDRVASALRNAGYKFPPRRITVNLSPANPRKQGSHYDLPIALAVLAASGQVSGGDWERRWRFIGELSLDGSVLPVPGVLAMAECARADGCAAIVVPDANADEAAAAGLPAYGVASLREVVGLLNGEAPRPRVSTAQAPPVHASDLDLAEVRGQSTAKRALEIAAAGGHNLLLIGPPGTGKSMLAHRLPGLLPPMNEAEAVEVTKIQSAAGRRGSGGLARVRPFRAPHHSCSAAALIGGGPSARPGEICLAHGGVLFLDELAEFPRPALEALRQPLEDRCVRVARAKESLEYPARFTLVAATNPCPCGWRGHPRKSCACPAGLVRRYLGRLSGPLLDRIDLQVETSAVPTGQWAEEPSSVETSVVAGRRVAAARERQTARYGAGAASANAFVSTAAIRRHGRLCAESLRMLAAAEKSATFSARSMDRIVRVARTIADLEGHDEVRPGHVAEAVGYRALDRLKTGLEGER